MRQTRLAVILLTAALAACAVDSSPTSTYEAAQPDTTTTSAPQTSTSTTPDAEIWTGRVGLYPMDPTSLVADDEESITSGDWITGSTSPSGEWLALSVWIDTDPDTDLIRIVDVSNRKVVAESQVLVPTTAVITDSETAYWSESNMAPFLRLYSLAPGDHEARLAFNEFPIGFEAWGDPTAIDETRLGWIGTFGPQTDIDSHALIVLDLDTMSTTTYPVPEIKIEGDEVEFGDLKIPEFYPPAVTWDGAGNRAFVVHADRDAFTAVDLSTGETDTHTWEPASSWLGRVFAWLIPPAQAKGPTLGTNRTADLNSDGTVLVVGTTTSRVETEEDSRFIAVWEP